MKNLISLHTTDMNPLIKLGKRFLDDGSQLEITHLQGSPGNQVMRLRQVNGSKTYQLSEERFIQHLETQRFVPLEDAMDEVDFTRNILGLNDHDYRRFNFKVGIVKIADATPNGTPIETSMRQISAFCEVFNRGATAKGYKARRVPDYKTVNRWLNLYRAAGNFWVFATSDHRRRQRKKGFQANIEDFVNSVIMTEFANSNRPSVRATHEELFRQARVLFPGYSEHELEVKLPSVSTLRRRIEDSDHFHLIKRRFGDESVRKSMNYGGQHRTAPFIGGRVEIDCVRCDVLVKHPTTGAVYRPWLMVFLDVYTRCVISWEFSLAAPNALMTTRAYQRSITQDDYPYRAIASLLVPDQGAEFINESFSRQVSVFNTTVLPAPPQSPNGKPYIERFFRTMNELVFHRLIGTTFSSPEDRGDYRSEKMARIWIKEVEKIFLEALTVYHHTVHKGLGKSPHQKWKEATRDELHPPRTVSAADAMLLGMKVERRCIVKGRVELYGLFWHGPGLPELNQRLRANGRKYAEVRVNPNNLEHVWVCDERNPHEVFRCDPILPEYQRNLTLDEHEAIKDSKGLWQSIKRNESMGRVIRADFQARLRELNLGHANDDQEEQPTPMPKSERTKIRNVAKDIADQRKSPKGPYIDFNDDDDLSAI